jgi:hypothetical protein
VVFGLVALLIVVPLGYCSLPLTQVAALTVAVYDDKNQAITSNMEAVFLDDAGGEIQRITPKTPGSWDNRLHWWSHSSHDTSLLRPKDARRARTVTVSAESCESASLPVTLQWSYEPISLFPHGSGAAFLYYQFERDVVLKCR